MKEIFISENGQNLDPKEFSGIIYLPSGKVHIMNKELADCLDDLNKENSSLRREISSMKIAALTRQFHT